MSKGKLRSSSTHKLGEVDYVHVSSLYFIDKERCVPFRQCPTGVQVLGRILHLTDKYGDNKLSRADAYTQAGKELADLWILKLNIYPLHNKSIAQKILAVYEEFLQFNKTHRGRRKEKWQENVSQFNKKMEKGFDIRTYDSSRINKVIAKYAIKMTTDEETLYRDNCFGDYTWKSSDRVDPAWAKNQARKGRLARYAEKVNEEAAQLIQNVVEADSDLDVEMLAHEQSEDDDVEFKPQAITISASNEEQIEFPQVKLRTGKRALNPKVMNSVVHCQAKYKLSENDTIGFCVDFANMVFDQNWSKPKEYERSHSSKSDDNAESGDEEEDLTNQFPSIRTVRRWLRSGALINLRHVADCLLNKSSEEVSTYGFDDTRKAAGVRLHDIKTDHITIISDEGKNTYTTGFTPNLSHSAKDQTTTLKHKLQTLALLAGEGTTEEDIIDHINFWMSDRASDNDIVLSDLGVEEEKVLKCTAHVVLGIDDALENVFKDFEQKVGRDVLAVGEMGAKVVQGSSSIIMLGLIALAKCLSPSHAALGFSLYTDYVTWRKKQGLSCETFKGFQSNRFGRMGYLASLFVAQHHEIQDFWTECIDEHSNKLVLAVTAYIDSPCFF